MPDLARPDPARPDPARPDSARPDPARPGSPETPAPVRSGGLRRASGLLDLADPVEVLSMVEFLRPDSAYGRVLVSPDGSDVMSSSGVALSVLRSLAEEVRSGEPVDTLMVVGGPGSHGLAADDSVVGRSVRWACAPGVWHLCTSARSSWPPAACSTDARSPPTGPPAIPAFGLPAGGGRRRQDLRDRRRCLELRRCDRRDRPHLGDGGSGP